MAEPRLSRCNIGSRAFWPLRTGRARKLSGLTALGQWMAAAYPLLPVHLVAFAQDVLGEASREELLDALLCVAGSVPFLHAVGGNRMLAEMLQRVCSIRDSWIESRRWKRWTR